MTDFQAERARMVEAVIDAARVLSTWTVLFHSVLAERVGLNGTDHKCLDIISHQDQPLTAGQLARITGLTTGAVTGVIDRLEKVGYVRREHDPADRRKILVRPIPEKAGEDLGPLFDHLAQRMRPLLEQYQESELALILSHIEQNARFMQEEIDWLRERAGQQEQR